MRKTQDNLNIIPTSEHIDIVREGSLSDIHREMQLAVKKCSEENRFFHWHLEFADVFTQDDTVPGGLSGGFDAVIGNPPWERIKIQEKEWFADKDPVISLASNKSEREKLILKLASDNPELFNMWQKAQHAAEAESSFHHNSGRYPLTGKGDINTYSVFSETIRQILSPEGKAGFIVPSGIATDDTTKFFFEDIMKTGQLACFHDFENRKGIFPGVHKSYKFSLLTLSGVKNPVKETAFSFFSLDTTHAQNPENRILLSYDDISLINPNTGTCPIFRTSRDAEITKKVYRKVPVLINEKTGANPWSVDFLRLFDMSLDSGLFRTPDDLEKDGYTKVGAFFRKAESEFVPLYEAKMIHQFDHRFGDYLDLPEGSKSTQLPDVPLEKLNDPSYSVTSRYYVDKAEVEKRLQAKGWQNPWLCGWRDICRSTDERTVISSIIPAWGVGDTFLLIFSRVKSGYLLSPIFCSFIFDYISRQKVGGTHIKYNVFKQLPVLPPETFEKTYSFTNGKTLGEFLKPIILELTYTSNDLKDFARALGYEGHPFPYDPERRFNLRTLLDAVYFYLYEITPEDADWIMESFPIVKRKDIAAHGTYRTKNRILETLTTLQKVN